MNSHNHQPTQCSGGLRGGAEEAAARGPHQMIICHYRFLKRGIKKDGKK